MSTDAKVIAVQTGSTVWNFFAALGLYWFLEKIDFIYWLSGFFGVPK